MIYDKIGNIAKYKGISKWFDDAIAFLNKTDLASLPLGRTEINDNHVYVNVMEADTKKEEDVSFEFHKKYWDIHIDIEGTETLQIGIENGKTVEEYREEDDFGTKESAKYIEVVLEPGCFFLCMEEELHKPTLRNGVSAKIKKCVIKVEVLPVV